MFLPDVTQGSGDSLIFVLGVGEPGDGLGALASGWSATSVGPALLLASFSKAKVRSCWSKTAHPPPKHPHRGVGGRSRQAEGSLSSLPPQRNLKPENQTQARLCWKGVWVQPREGLEPRVGQGQHLLCTPMP